MLLPDDSARRLAWGSENCVVVEASAGTGKTFLLVQRALWHIFVKKREISRLVALAFGDKAAREMAKRLRDVLGGVAAAPSLEKLPPELALMNHGESLAALQKKAREAIAGFQRARISTIHSFAADILRLFPVEAGVDPGFLVDQGRAFREEMDREWDRFLARELGRAAPRAQMWRDLLAKVQLDHVSELASELAGFRVDLDRVMEGRRDRDILLDSIRPRLESLRKDCDFLRGTYPRKDGGEPAGAELFLDSMAKALVNLLAGKEIPEELVESLKGGNYWSKKIGPEGEAMGRKLEAAAVHLRHVRNEETVYQVTEALRPFAEQVRKSLLETGRIPYEGLLSLARDLLRGNPGVREAVKRRFDGIMVDEAQDVDPMQLEIILYLAEREGQCAGKWEDVRLHPGKLFLVGDPKQSIYGFRNADLTAFNEVMKRAKADGADSVVLTTSMRSDGKVIDFINETGKNIIPGGGEESRVEYSPLKVNPQRKGGLGRPRAAFCEVRIGKGEKKWRMESEAAASWIKNLIDAEKVPPGDIAVLFKSRAWMSRYADALRSTGVPVTIEGERDFFNRPETTDLLNILFLLADPSDDIALAGILRGPFGALDGPALHKWFAAWRAGGSSPLLKEMKKVSGMPGHPAHLPGLFSALERLAGETGLVPWRAWIERIWSELGVDELAGRSGRIGAGEAVTVMRRLLAGLLEERGMAEGLNTLRSCREAEQNKEDVEITPPVPPVQQDRNRVRLMTIHQAKGLEFPVVVLGGIGSRDQHDSATDTGFMEDWSTGRRGAAITAKLSSVALSTLAGAVIRMERRARDEEENGRVMYVALTRARDLLMVMKPQYETLRGFSTPKYIHGIAGSLTGESPVAQGESAPPFRAGKRGAGSGPAPVAGPEYPAVDAQPELLTPSTLAMADRSAYADDRWQGRAGSQSFDLVLGEVCHRVLERWEYGAPADGITGALEDAVESLDPRQVNRNLLVERAGGLLKSFLSSGAAGELARARILGREVPILAGVDGKAVNARADIIFELDGKLFVGDYKTGSDPRVSSAVARAYADAATSALGTKAEFRLISLAKGTIGS